MVRQSAVTAILVIISNMIIPILLFMITQLLLRFKLSRPVITILTKPLFQKISDRVEKDHSLHHPGKEFNRNLLYFIYLFGGVTIYQFVYIIPLVWQLLQAQKFNLIKGIIVGVICTFLLNGGCFLQIM
ncbi:MAG TPA: hypothetical protein V6C58_22745 [Allocoleopsis sp.]